MKNTHPIYIHIISILCFFTTAFSEKTSVKRIGQPLALQADDNFINPKFSPDGKYVSLTKQHYNGIYLYNLKNKEIKVITQDHSAGFGMSWSKNSEQILSKPAVFNNKRRLNSIVIYNIMNDDKSIIFEDQTSFPGIPVWRNNDNYITMNGGKKLKLFESILGKESNNSSGKIIYSTENSIIEYDLKSENKNILFLGEGDILNLHPSPDEEKLVFEVVGGNLWVLDIQTLKKTNLGIGHEPAWNSRSDKIAYMITQDDGHVITSSDIYIINADGTKKTNLTNTPNKLEMRPDWHHGEKWIIYDLDGLGPIHIQLVE
ncbi:MAG: hypothetical protein H8E08_00260 [Candidatus Marinimicrobia bacterium]|nr:hypothetical protein [Candidatus Neomarinimicrobiota bacterium]